MGVGRSGTILGKNCTFVIKHYFTGGLLYHDHLLMGEINFAMKTCGMVHQRLHRALGTSLMGKGKRIAAKGFRYSFLNEQESRIMLCRGKCV